MKTIRYVWSGEARYLYPSIDWKREEKIETPYSDKPIFVNILETKIRECDDLACYYVKLFYDDGSIVEGWVWSGSDPIIIMNKDLLFDGRFNQ